MVGPRGGRTSSCSCAAGLAIVGDFPLRPCPTPGHQSLGSEGSDRRSRTRIAWIVCMVLFAVASALLLALAPT